MGRQVNKLLFGPPAVCDACGGFACTLDQAGMPCYHCGTGTFLNRVHWRFEPCPECHGHDWCTHCKSRGMVAIRKR